MKTEVPTPAIDESCIENDTARALAPQDKHPASSPSKQRLIDSKPTEAGIGHRPPELSRLKRITLGQVNRSLTRAEVKASVLQATAQSSV